MSVRLRLTVLSFLQYAVWGAYLTSIGGYLARVGLGGYISWFFCIQGLISLFMPALMGIVADRWVQAPRLLSLLHLLAGLLMVAMCLYSTAHEPSGVSFATLFSLYTLSILFFMPTIALSNSTAFVVLERAGIDIVKAFPPIRVWGTIGFVVSMWIVDIAGWQLSALQFAFCGCLGVVLSLYALSLPSCPVTSIDGGRTLADAFGLRAFRLFVNRRIATFLVFSVLLGCCLHISNAYASPYLHSFAASPAYVGTFGVRHAGILISLSQISEALCLLLIPFFFRRYGIKCVVLIATTAWMLRYGLFAYGNPGSGLWLLVLSMLVYGVAFDFFNVSGSMFMAAETPIELKSSAQGLFMMMSNGIGASLGMVAMGWVVNRFTTNLAGLQVSLSATAGWREVWLIFAAYALVVTILFALFFRR